MRAETRRRVRVLCKSYSALALVWVLPIVFVLTLVEALGLARHAALAARVAVVGAGSRRRAHPGELAGRSETQRSRQVDDGDVRDLMIRGSARFRSLLVQRLHAGDRLADVSTARGNAWPRRATSCGARRRSWPSPSAC